MIVKICPASRRVTGIPGVTNTLYFNEIAANFRRRAMAENVPHNLRTYPEGV
jgi:hypothetical protein